MPYELLVSVEMHAAPILCYNDDDVIADWRAEHTNYKDPSP